MMTRRTLLAALASLAAARRGSAAGPGKPAASPGHAIFAAPRLLNITLSVAPHGQSSLRSSPREWVRAAVTIEGQEFPEVGVHLKGVTSFLPLDKKPSWTLHLGKYMSGRRVFGLRKFHLNNSVQDSSFVCDDLASELFRRAGVPAARTAWAKVRLNERELGLYVLKEGFAEELLAMYFSRTDGNLYECGTHQDVFDCLERDSGKGPDDFSDLKDLHAASQIAEVAARWQALQKRLDLDGFISMLAMETLTCHVDGYSRMQNNYRVYFDPASGRASFLVSGLDQMFGDPRMPLESAVRAVLALAVLGVPQGQELYRSRLAELAGGIFTPAWMCDRIDAAIRVIEPADAVAARDARLTKERVLARAAFVQDQLPKAPVRP